AVVYSIPYIYRFFDVDGDDRADQRVVLYGKFAHVDTHGLVSAFTRGFDGWIYGCHGFTNKSTVTSADGSRVVFDSGNTFRARPDGERLESFTKGQVNPFGLSFDPWGTSTRPTATRCRSTSSCRARTTRTSRGRRPASASAPR